MSKVSEDRSGGHGALRGIWLRRRYAILFYTLLLTMVAVPLLAAFEVSGALIELLLAASLLAAVMPGGTARSRGALLTVTALVWLARPLTAWLDHPAISAMTLGLWTLIGLFAATVALRFALRGVKVDSEHLYAALSAYLLAGVYFGLLYWVLEQVRPSTFVSAGNFSRTGAVYFSFVTLGTLGYGDIIPIGGPARALAVTEAIGGQIYLVVVVARLVSLYRGGTAGIDNNQRYGGTNLD